MDQDTPRDRAVAEIADRLAVLTLDEMDLDFDLVVAQLAGVKQAIDALAAEARSEPWLIEWLEAEHMKGSMLYVGSVTNYRKQLSDGVRPPFDPATRAALVGRFNAWAPTAAQRLALYEASARDAAVVGAWLQRLAAFRADPVHND